METGIVIACIGAALVYVVWTCRRKLSGKQGCGCGCGGCASQSKCAPPQERR